MSLILEKQDSNEEILRKHVDYDKKDGIFYANFYFPEINYVLKTPMASDNDVSFQTYKIEKFDLLKYSFLMYY